MLRPIKRMVDGKYSLVTLINKEGDIARDNNI
jgi:hypothetical protein